MTYDSKTELLFLQEFIEPRLESGEILSYTRQVEYVLQDKFKYNGKTILPVKYRSDYNVVWADGTLQVFDVKGNPDNLSLLKRKLMWAKYEGVEIRPDGTVELTGVNGKKVVKRLKG